MNKDLPYIKHILDSINDIEESVKNISKKEFMNHKDKRDSNIKRIEIIGEAAKNISKETKNKHPEVEWRKLAGARDVMIHAYFKVDLDVVWNIIERDMPKLKKDIIKIKKELE